MFLSKWFVSIVALLAVDTRTRALHQNDVEARLCYQCPSNAAAGAATCEGAQVSTRACPAGLPYCATVATAPNFTSSLTCAAASDTTCTLIYFAKQSYEMTCACTTNLCNAPFSRVLQNELMNFSSSFVPTNFRGDFTAVFWKSSSFENGTKETNLYKMITIAIAEAPIAPTQFFADETNFNDVGQDSTMKLLRHSEKVIGPRVAALKQETAEPDDDDEDGGEGSGAGAYEQTAHAPAPAAPSSYLPADKSRAALLFNNFLTTTLIIFNVFM